jgi:hypothetical protein
MDIGVQLLCGLVSSDVQVAVLVRSRLGGLKAGLWNSANRASCFFVTSRVSPREIIKESFKTLCIPSTSDGERVP